MAASPDISEAVRLLSRTADMLSSAVRNTPTNSANTTQRQVPMTSTQADVPDLTPGHLRLNEHRRLFGRVSYTLNYIRNYV